MGPHAPLSDAGWGLYRGGDNSLKLEVWVHISAAGPSLGLLLAVCNDSLEALPAVSYSLTIQLCLWGGLSGAAGVQEVADLVAPLRSLAESVTFGLQSKPACQSSVSVRKSQVFPLGKLIVLVY